MEPQTCSLGGIRANTDYSIGATAVGPTPHQGSWSIGGTTEEAPLKRILALAAALSGARTSDEVADIMVRQGVEALQASTGVFVQPRSDGRLEIIADYGIAEPVIEANRT